jgi:hypothetical protein
MKNIKLALLTLGVSCSLVSIVNANSFRFDFVPTSGSSAMTGTYIDFSTANGSGSGASILDYHIVTPGGVFTDANSSVAGLLTWNAASSWLTGTATFAMDSLPIDLVTFASVLNTGYETTWTGAGNGFGTWKAEVVSVPDPANTLLLLAMGLGLLGAASYAQRPRRLALV